MSQVKFAKVNILHASLDPDTIYLLQTADGLVIHASDKNGVSSYRTLTKSDFTSGSSGPTINGPTTVYANEETIFDITNFDINTTYTLTDVIGTAVITDHYIAYTPPAVAGTGGFKLNGISYELIVIDSYIEKPNVIFPESYATGVPANPTVLSSEFLSHGIVDTHKSSTWQISTDSLFRSIIAQVTESTINLTQWLVEHLDSATKYYVRVKHHGNMISTSEWSAAVQFTTKVHGFPDVESAVLLGPTPATGEYGGYATAVSANGLVAAIGIPLDIVNGVGNRGTVSIYKQTNGSWTLDKTLNWSNTATTSYYGSSLSLSEDGSWLAVGAPRYNNATGAVVIYHYDNSTKLWSEVGTYQPSGGNTNNYAGFSVAFDSTGTRFVMGCYGNTSYRGRVVVFTYSNGTFVQEAILTASDVASNDYFGISVSISGDGSTIASGAYLEDPSYTNAGSVYIFTRSDTTWTQETKLYPSTRMANMYFGYNIALTTDGTRLVIGAYNTTVDSLMGVGSLHVFYNSNLSGWIEEAYLVPSDLKASANFGFSVAIDDDGDFIVVGAPNGNTNTVVTSGACYIFTRDNTTWSESHKLIPSQLATGDKFGYSVALSTDASVALVGAITATRLTYTQAGCVNVFS